MAPELPLKIIGIRPGEKLHEVMCPKDDSHLTLEFESHYVIKPSFMFDDSSIDFALSNLGEKGTEVETGYIIIEADAALSWKWYKFDLPQLLRKTVTSEDEMVPTDYHHTIYELEGDMADLSAVANTELLDKKVIKRKTETALLLSKEMTIEEELVEYLSYILELDETKVQDVLTTFHDYSKEIAMG